MQPDDKSVWNRKYAEAPEKWLEPDPFLVYAWEHFLKPATPGMALDVAGGAGRHAIWLADRGWQVKVLDVSDVGLQLARHNAVKVLGEERAGKFIDAETVDLNTVTDLGRQLYDLVLVFRYLNRELFPALSSALKPGGTLIYSTYTTAQLKFGKGPTEPQFLLQPGELRQAFSALRVLHHAETAKDRGVAELIASKPLRA
ncbi:MAG TPA: class I SAM-dependent methyltransferase [Candidatus Angelobacter sp.]|nr:class I SAM-dependent methyltransferase [Candidatus Angelobacter sp.]